jgi:endonuclease/exonuclease/phosphatase family metal-dependent hydrolase
VIGPSLPERDAVKAVKYRLMCALAEYHGFQDQAVSPDPRLAGVTPPDKCDRILTDRREIWRRKRVQVIPARVRRDA